MVPDNSNSYSLLDPILQIVHVNKIKLEKSQKSDAVKLCQKVENKVKEKLKSSDSLLKDLINGTKYRGSYYGGVKVGSPDEFDIDIQLKLPFNESDIKMENSHEYPGFIKFNIQEAYDKFSKTPSWANKYGLINKWMDKDGYLLETKIRKELERVFTKQFPQGKFQLDLDGVIAETVIRKSGPAFTFHLKFEDMNIKKIDIDFVFVLYFDSIWPSAPIQKFDRIPPKMRKNWWLAVPKPNDCPQSWRLSFPLQEEYYLDRAYNLKFIYRLLKALRDSMCWNLASYYIATLFLWESKSVEESNDFEFWNQSTGNLFVYMLKKLAEALKEGNLKFFWHEDFNLIKDVKRSTLDIMENCINKMIKQIDRYNKPESKDQLQNYILNTVYRCELQ